MDNDKVGSFLGHSVLPVVVVVVTCDFLPVLVLVN